MRHMYLCCSCDVIVHVCLFFLAMYSTHPIILAISNSASKLTNPVSTLVEQLPFSMTSARMVFFGHLTSSPSSLVHDFC